YLQFAAGEKRPWLRAMGLRFFPVVGWAERGDGRAEGHGNSVPRFHITWGTGPGVVEPFVRRLEAHRAAGRIHLATRLAAAVLSATGGIGGNAELVRQPWPAGLGTMPDSFVHGVPASVDGAGMQLAAAAGAHWIHQDRMWHYTEGIRNWDPVWRAHGIRILPGPSSLWVDARGERLPAPALPGFDTTSTLRHLRSTGH